MSEGTEAGVEDEGLPLARALTSLRAGTARRIDKPGQVFNRIHVDDIGAAIDACFAYAGEGRVWNVTDDDNVAYSMNLVQAGNGVTGQFKGADGSRGTLVGKVNGNTLRFAWVQTNDGQKGSGKFVLAGDGGSFSGSYNFQVGNFDKVEGQWNGQRR